MPFIEIKAGASSDIQPGVYAVTLTEISDPRTVTAQRGPNAGKDIDLIDWTFVTDDGATIDGSTSTASGPKSKMYAYLTALFGGIAPPIGTQLEKDQLVGRMALATIQLDEGGWPRIVNLGALPNTMPLPTATPPAVPTDNSAVVKQRAPRRAPPAAETMVGATGQPLVPAGRDADLPF